jgi:hypothetical protein
MKYTVEESLQDFRAWSGGKDTLDDLWAYDRVDEAEEYINMIMNYREELPTQTDINDILWFDRNDIYRYCGIYNAVYNEDDEEEKEEE